MTEPRRRKHIRLPLEAYGVPGLVWHVTSNTHDRKPVFADPDWAEKIIESITFQCSRNGADLLTYCVMPDHVHLAIQINGTNLITILKRFKSWTGHLWKDRTGESPLWQESFYDHGVRRCENMDDLVRYVTENPVRTGLVEHWRDYPWTGGSLVAGGQRAPKS
jgi:putative transposase